MNINDLPDLCFELIFDHISDLPTLDNLRRVCSRWRTLVQTRLQKITHLEYAPYMVLVKKITQKELTGKYIHTDQLRFLESIKLSLFLPNVKCLKLRNITTRLPCPCAALANLLATGNPITELKFRLCDFTSGLPSHRCKTFLDLDEKIIPYLDNVENLSTNVKIIVDKYFRAHGHLNKLKKLRGVPQTGSSWR